jgi:hypothetical protein
VGANIMTVFAMFKKAVDATHTIKAKSQTNQVGAVKTIREEFDKLIADKLPATYAFSYAVISAHGKKITDFSFLNNLLLAQLKRNASVKFDLSQLAQNNTVDNALTVTKAVLAFVKANETNIRELSIPEVSIKMSHPLNAAQQQELTDALKDISVNVTVSGNNFNLTNPPKYTYAAQRPADERTGLLQRQDSGDNNELTDKRSSTHSVKCSF